MSTPILGYDKQTLQIDGTKTMNSTQMATVLKFLMSKLSAADLEELDGLLEGGGTPVAQDSRLTPETRKKWLDMTPHTRNAIRSADQAQASRSSDAAKGFAQRYPDAARLGRV